jgi:hypothetical protein
MPRKPWLLLVLVLCAIFATAEKKKARQEFIRPNQVFEIPDAAATFATATRGCANDVWAASVTSILRLSKVEIPAKEISTKLAGGDACLPALPELDLLRKSIEGDYQLGNGRQVRLAVVVSHGPPQAADPLAVLLAAGEPLIVIYKGQPLLLFGMTYDEHIINNLRKELWITELRMVDPAAQPGTDQRVVTIKREGTDAQNIEAILEVKVIPMQYGELETH